MKRKLSYAVVATQIKIIKAQGNWQVTSSSSCSCQKFQASQSQPSPHSHAWRLKLEQSDVNKFESMKILP